MRLCAGSLWGFDIECASWDRLVLAIAINHTTGETLRFRSRDEVRDWYLTTTKDDLIISHYGGGYDFIFLITCVDTAWSVKLAGATIASMRVRGHAECRDSMKLFPGSLDSWTGRKTRLSKDHFPCVCDRRQTDHDYDCGGYCSLSTDLSRPAFADLESYAVNDVRVMIDQYVSDIELLHAGGFSVLDDRGSPRLTVGALAWNTAAPMAGLDPKEPIAWDEYDAGIACYYGGRTEVGAVRSYKIVYRDDVNSMYPWALTLPVPVGKRRSYNGAGAREAYAKQKPGSYYACVYAPDDTSLPPLPHRAKGLTLGSRRHSGSRLVWANGYIKGWWTHIELSRAEETGAKIVAIAAAEVYDREEAIYKPFIDHVYGLREAATIAKDKRLSARYKWIANSLTGKLAQNPEQCSARVLGSGDDPPDVDCSDPNKPRWRWAGGRVWISPPVRRVPSCARPMHAATLTSRARVKLRDRLIRHEDDWLNCDTDCTYTEIEDNTDCHESRLGAWKREGIFLAGSYSARGPKDYRGIDGDGREIVKIKGIPQARWDTWDVLATGGTVTSRDGVDKLRSCDGEFRRRDLSRASRADPAYAGTRHVTASGRTRPLWRTRDGRYT